MAIKICMWFLIVMAGSLAFGCFLSSVACLYTGKVVAGFLMGWIGLLPAALTAFAWWAKDKLMEWL